MNLTEAAFRRRPLVGMVLLALMIFGAASYLGLPAREDPKITIRTSVIVTEHPGLSTEKMERLITRPLEEAVRRVPEIDEIRSLTMPGRSIIHAEVDPAVFKLEQIWDDLRSRVAAAAAGLPDGTGPPWVNTDFGDVAIVTAALVGEDHDWGTRFAMAEEVRDRLYAVPGVKRIDLLGVQTERLFVEVDPARLAALTLDPDRLGEVLRARNALGPGGVLDVGPRGFLVETTGAFETVEDLSEFLIPLPDGRGVIPLRDVAEVRRAPVDPPDRPAYFNGRPAIVLAISMKDGESVLDTGHALRDALADVETTLPAGFGLEIMTFQADQVANAVYGVTASVAQTLVIVLVVVVLFLGLRTGLIVGAIVPAVMLVTLAVMNALDMTLQRMSLATLVIALGLLVDNGIVVAEDFKRRLEEGESRDEALRRGGRELALPLLVSTLITILVFLPLMLAEHTAGEYTRSISLVILISLLTSWVLAMTVTPALCHKFIKVAPSGGGRRASLPDRAFAALSRGYERLLRILLRVRRAFLIVMLALLIAAVAGMGQVPKKFFPDSDRSQILAFIDLPAGATSRATDATLNRVFDALETPGRVPHVDSYAAYIGSGGPRFVLSLTPIDRSPNVAFMVANVEGAAHMEQVTSDLRAMFREVAPEAAARVTRMFLGPSDSSKLEVMVTGPDAEVLFEAGRRIGSAFRAIPGARDIATDWHNRIAKVVVEVDQTRARRAGVTAADVSRALTHAVEGRVAAPFRDGDDPFPILLRADAETRRDLERLATVPVFSATTGRSVPLAQVADLGLEGAYGRIARRDLRRALTVEARNVAMTAEDMVPLMAPALAELRATLPPGHSVRFDGVIADSAESRAALAANTPLCLAVIVVLLVAQFNSYRRPLIIVATIPLILIGAVAGLLMTGANFGFMPILGLFALSGIITINAIVLIDRIDLDRAAGMAAFEAVVTASVRRLRPILMTTITTILGLAPLIVGRDALFYGMASVIAFGLLVGTLLTLGVVPVLYSLLFGIRAPSRRAA